jgi:hypothetical protein
MEPLGHARSRKPDLRTPTSAPPIAGRPMASMVAAGAAIVHNANGKVKSVRLVTAARQLRRRDYARGQHRIPAVLLATAVATPYACPECGQRTALDYCRSHDEFYHVHAPGCSVFLDHLGHRLTVVPFIEVSC